MGPGAPKERRRLVRELHRSGGRQASPSFFSGLREHALARYDSAASQRCRICRRFSACLALTCNLSVAYHAFICIASCFLVSRILLLYKADNRRAMSTMLSHCENTSILSRDVQPMVFFSCARLMLEYAASQVKK